MPSELIVIDGPAGAGKSTVARLVAAAIGASMLDTGAIYRSLAWLSRARDIAWTDEPGLAELATQLRIEFRPPAEPGQGQRVVVRAPLGADPGTGEGLDLTHEIRTSDISEGASRVSAHSLVRGALLGIQRGIAADSLEAGRSCVAEGRDMGTVVFPQARHKFFLTASRGARAHRRHQELRSRGESVSLEQVEREMAQRDERDSSRESSPLQQAHDATLVDSSELSLEDVIAQILGHIGHPSA